MPRHPGKGLAKKDRCMPLRRAAILCFTIALTVLAGGCGESRFDETKLYQGMDRTGIIARFGSPDAILQHDNAERLIYKDGEHYQYLLMLIDGKLDVWHHDRVYKTNRF